MVERAGAPRDRRFSRKEPFHVAERKKNRNEHVLNRSRHRDFFLTGVSLSVSATDRNSKCSFKVFNFDRVQTGYLYLHDLINVERCLLNNKIEVGNRHIF